MNDISTTLDGIKVQELNIIDVPVRQVQNLAVRLP